MIEKYTDNKNLQAIVSGIAAWFIPGLGYLVLGQKKRAVVVFVTLAATFLLGIFIGSIGVIDPVTSKPWYVAQILNSPLVSIIGHTTESGQYMVYGKPYTIGQIYTSIAGLLNMLVIINCVHLALTNEEEVFGGENVSTI